MITILKIRLYLNGYAISERTSPFTSPFMDLVALGNRAAHGVEVSQNAADWVLDVGSSIILELDNLLTQVHTPEIGQKCIEPE